MTQYERLAKKNNADASVQIEKLKEELAKYDYIGVKIATGAATIAEYAAQIAYCETLREQIRALED